MCQMEIVVVDGRPSVYSWTDGFKTRREESLAEIAQKSDDHLLQVCLWLEKHGQNEEALELLERILRLVPSGYRGTASLATESSLGKSVAAISPFY